MAVLRRLYSPTPQYTPLIQSKPHYLNAIRVAYADDHEMVRKGIIGYINTFEGCSVILEANDGNELLLQMEHASQLPDICILDIFMPVLNGLETLIQIKARWSHIRVLILTGHSTDYYLTRMIRAGADGYLQKNCSPKELETALRSIQDNGIYSPDVETYKFYRAVKNNEVKLPEFSEKEIALLKHCCSDLSYDQIAQKLNTTLHSVDWYRNSLFKKLNVGSRSSLVMYAIQFGLVALDIDATAQSLKLKKH